MLWLMALLACPDRVSPDNPVDGTYRISDPADTYAQAANGSAIIDGDRMIFEYTDVNGTAWKVTYVRRESDSAADSPTE